MVVEEIIKEQKRYLADVKKRANGSQEERRQVREESRNRLIAAGILQEDGQIAEPYRKLFG